MPRSLKASIKAIFEEVATTEPALIARAIRDGIKARPPKSFPYVQLAAAYLDGKPTEHLSLDGDLNLRVIIEARERLARKLAGLSARIGATAVSGESQ